MDFETINQIGMGESKPVQVSTPVVSEKTASDTAPAVEQQKGTDGKPLAESTVRETVTNINQKMTSTRCEFSYHKGTHRVSIKVIDKDSDEIIREIPPEKSLEMLEKMWDLAGLFVDKRK